MRRNWPHTAGNSPIYQQLHIIRNSKHNYCPEFSRAMDMRFIGCAIGREEAEIIKYADTIKPLIKIIGSIRSATSVENRDIQFPIITL